MQISGSWAQISSGIYDYVIGIQTNGTLWSWGAGTTGQTGHGNTSKTSSPVQIGTATTWTSVSAGNGFAAAIQSNGTLWAWGENSTGQLGNGTTVSVSSPIQVAGSWTQVSAGYATLIGVHTDGSVWGCGENGTFELGTKNGGWVNFGTPQCFSSPVQLAGTWSQVITTGSPGTSVAAAYGLGVQTNGTLWGWGDNSYGQLAQTITSGINYSPLQIAGSWSLISAGGPGNYPFVVATQSNGSLWAWGVNINGQLCQGNTTNTSSPVLISSASWTQISASAYHWAALRSDKTFWSGGGTPSGAYSSPVQLAGSWTVVSAGVNPDSVCNTMGIKTNGTLWVMGGNQYGELGLGNTTAYTSPVQVLGSWLQVSSGFYGHALGIKSNGSLWAWGYNDYGQIGVGNLTSYSSPVQVASGSWSQVWACAEYSYALNTQGVFFAWGNSGWGSWGGGWPDEGSGYTSSPVQVPSSWVMVAPLGTIGGFGIRYSAT